MAGQDYLANERSFEGPASVQEERASVDNELRSLFALIDDPDRHVAEAVEERLRTRISASSNAAGIMSGTSVLTALLEFARTAHGLARERAMKIGLEFHIGQLAEEFDTLDKQLAADDPNALEDGVFLIARYSNPTLDVDYYKSFLDDYAGVLRNRVAKRPSPLEVLNECNYLFFEEFKYRGNQTKFMDPENSYIHRVIERKSGIPISLAVLYLLVVETRLKLPFSGASAPGHFLIRYDGLSSGTLGANPEPLFVDAFNGGVILRERDIKRYLDTSGLPFNRAFLDPATPRSILLRMIRNLIIVFNEQGDHVGRAAFERFMRILAPDSPEGIAFLRGLEGS
jgi:regulator of sirC expression with transglutaminase-like and TPR domain